MGLPLVCSSLKSCRGTPDQRSTRRSPDHLHQGVLGEAKVAANRTPREAGVCSSTSALNGRWRLISAMYACTREGPYKIPCAIDTPKAREAGVFDVRSSVVLNHLILYEDICYCLPTEIGADHVHQDQARSAIHTCEHTDRQTVENQISELRQVAERRGWEVVEIYRDAGISGAK